MPYAPSTAYHGDQYLSDAVASIGENVQKAIDTYEENKKQQVFGEHVLSILSQTPDPNNPDQMLASPQDLADYTKAGHSAKQGIIMAKLADIPGRFSKTFAESDKLKAEAEYYRAKASGDENAYTPPQSEIDAASAAGRTFVHTTRGSGQYLDTPPPPELDSKGNPVFTPDGTMYKGKKGQFYPVTGPMMQAKLVFDSLKKVAPGAAQTIQGSPDFNHFDPNTWSGAAGGGGAGAGPPAYPLGTHMRSGNMWYVMTPQGPQPDPTYHP